MTFFNAYLDGHLDPPEARAPHRLCGPQQTKHSAPSGTTKQLLLNALGGCGCGTDNDNQKLMEWIVCVRILWVLVCWLVLVAEKHHTVLITFDFIH